MARATQRNGALTLLLLWLGFMTGWTLGSVPLTLAGAPFGSLWVALLCGLVGGGLSLRAYAPLAALLLTTPEPDATLISPSRPQIALATFSIVFIFAATLWFIPTGDARPLWLVSLLSCFLIFNTIWSNKRDRIPELIPQAGPALPSVALLALILWTIYVITLRHDADDAFYLNLPIGLANAPHGMLVWDTMYGAENWPILGSNYKVEALQTLIAAIAYVSGIPVVYVAHLIVPTIWCLIWSATLALLGTALFGRKWWVFSILAVLSSFAFAGSLQNWGVHGITRLFHGKAPLILIIIPLIYMLTHRADMTGMPLRKVLPLLAGLITIGVGLTANAIYIAPLALGLALFAGWVARGFRQPRRLWLLMAAAPALAAGLWLFLFDTPASVPDSGTPPAPYTDLALWSMFPDKVPLGLLALTIAAACCAPLLVSGARFITGCLLGTLLFVLNPVLGPLYDDYVTGGLSFRLWWAIPLPFLFALFVTATVVHIRQIWLLPAVGALLLAFSFSPTGLLGMYGTQFSISFLKLPSGMPEVVHHIKILANDRKVLANEEVAAWLPTTKDHPPLVYVRALYLDDNTAGVSASDLGPRQILADWVNKAGDITVENVLDALHQQCPRLLVFPSGKKPANFDALSAQIGAEPAGTVQSLQIFYIEPNCQ